MKDFSFDLKETEIKSGVWKKEKDGSLKGIGNPGHFLTFGNKDWADYDLEAKIKMAGSTNKKKDWVKSYLFFRFQDKNNFYRVGVHGDSRCFHRTMFELSKCEKGNWSIIDNKYVRDEVFEKKKWNTFRVELKNARIKVYLNDELLINTLEDTFFFGSAGIGDLDDEMINYFKDIKMTNISEKKISIAIQTFQRQLIKKDIVVKIKTGSFENHTNSAIRAEAKLVKKGDAKPIKTINIENFDERNTAFTEFDISGLEKEKYYEIAVKLTDKNNKELAFSSTEFKVWDFPWLNSDIGKTDDVLSPWTPIETQGKKINVWGRTFDLSGSYLPKINNQGKDVLSSAIKLSSSIDGKAYDLAKIQPEFKTKKDSKVSFEAKKDFGAFNVKASGFIEYDGLTWYDVAIIPKQNINIQKLVLVIPVKKEFATLYSHPKQWVYNIKNSGAIPKKGLDIMFKGSTWIGNEELGLDWFAESDKEWNNKNENKVVHIRTNKKTAFLKVSFVDMAFKTDKPVVFSFGLEPTPMKPMPKKGILERRIIHGAWYGMERSEGRSKISFLEKIQKTGFKTIIYHESWTDYNNYTSTKYEDKLKNLVDALHAKGIKFAPYFGYEMADIAPEFAACNEECLRKKPLQVYDKFFYTMRKPAQNDYGVCYNSHWQDFIVYGVKKLEEKFGVDGIYLDGTAIIWGCPNTNHGCGYIGKDGKIKETFPIFAIREIMKRLYKIFYIDKNGGMVNAHNSSCNTAAVLAFATSYLNGEEYNFGALGSCKKRSGFLKVLGLDTFRAEHMGKNWGVPAEFLVNNDRLWNFDTGLSISLLHDVLVHPNTMYVGDVPKIWNVLDDFGIGENDHKWLGYWKNKDFVKTNGKMILSSIHSRGEKGALVVVSNLTDSKKNAKIKLNLEKLGLSGKKLIALDTMANKKIPIDQKGNLKTEIKSFGWKLIWIK